jgi:hypothetical protein
MGKFTVTHEIPCSVETFWKVFFDKEFNESLFLKELGFPEFKVLEARDTDKEVFRRVTGTPKMNLPGPIAKLLGPGFKYTEDGTFDKATQTWRWKMTPSTLAEKLRNEGSMRIEKIGEDRVRRIADIVVEAKIFGIGGLMESTTEKELRNGWDKSADFMKKWLSDPSRKA